MSTSDEYIIVENSKNLDDDKDGATIENENDSERTLEKQGIFIESDSGDGISGEKPLSDFAQELMNEGGIEIMPSGDEDNLTI